MMKLGFERGLKAEGLNSKPKKFLRLALGLSIFSVFTFVSFSAKSVLKEKVNISYLNKGGERFNTANKYFLSGINLVATDDMYPESRLVLPGRRIFSSDLFFNYTYSTLSSEGDLNKEEIEQKAREISEALATVKWEVLEDLSKIQLRSSQYISSSSKQTNSDFLLSYRDIKKNKRKLTKLKKSVEEIQSFKLKTTLIKIFRVSLRAAISTIAFLLPYFLLKKIVAYTITQALILMGFSEFAKNFVLEIMNLFDIPNVVAENLRLWYNVPDPIWEGKTLSVKTEGYLSEAEEAQSYFESLFKSSGFLDIRLNQEQREKLDRFNWLLETIEKEIKRLLGR